MEPEHSKRAAPDDLLEGLNDAQRSAVVSEAAPLGILAGAGSGKTRVLTRRIAYRAATGDLDPRHVLALTFTRKAAGELTHRLRDLGLRDNVAAGTFHAIAYAQLRARWADRNITPPTLLERKVGFVARLLPERGADGTLALDVVSEIEWAKARMVTPADYATEATEAGRRPPITASAVAEVFDRYEAEKRSRRMIDFDDLLRLARRDLLADRAFQAAQRWRFQHLFVDEFQDVNPLQQALLDAWLGDRVDLCVVGDPNQAIYAWNGAEPRFLLEFTERYPGASMVRLTANYRSSPQILAVANGVLGERGLKPTRPDAALPEIRAFPDDRSEARGIARSLRDRRAPGTAWGDQAVLVRTNAQAGVLAEALREVDIPFRIRGGGALLEQAEVKQALREIRAAGELSGALTDLEASVHTSVPLADPEADRVANIEALVRLGRDYLAIEPTGAVPGFLSWLNEAVRADRPDRQGDAVEISTFHAAKGLEWPVVHLAGLEHGLVPIGHARTPAAQAEERRLFYVAVTRAERELHLSYADERTFGSRVAHRERSPYLEMVETVLEALDRGTDPANITSRSRSHSRARRPRKTTSPESATATSLDPSTHVIFEALREWRSGKAKAAAVPAYVICHDATLQAVASAHPRSHADLLGLPGLGQVRVSRYGDELLDVVAAHAKP